jgi:hypothetical protein
MRVSNLEEYVGKYAIAYLRARDEELQALLKFKKASTCTECDRTFLPLKDQRQAEYRFCCSCQKPVHFFTCSMVAWSSSTGVFCNTCGQDIQKQECAHCNTDIYVCQADECDGCEKWYCSICIQCEDYGRLICTNGNCHLFK